MNRCQAVKQSGYEISPPSLDLGWVWSLGVGCHLKDLPRVFVYYVHLREAHPICSSRIFRKRRQQLGLRLHGDTLYYGMDCRT